jgi:hypothetical protein
LLAAAGPAQAAFVTVSFSGEVGFVLDPVTGLTPTPGEAVTGFFTYDTTTSDGNPDPTVGFYSSGSSSITIGATTLTSGGPGQQSVGSDTLVLSDVVSGLQLQVILNRAPAASDSLPTAADLNGSFTPGTLVLTDPTGGLVLFENLQFTATEVSAVPEPSSLALLGAGAGFAAIGAVRRRRRNADAATITG